jgi:hypothetical protein
MTRKIDLPPEQHVRTVMAAMLVGRTTRKSVSGAISIGPMAPQRARSATSSRSTTMLTKSRSRNWKRAKRCSSEPFLTPDLDLISGHGPVS